MHEGNHAQWIILQVLQTHQHGPHVYAQPSLGFVLELAEQEVQVVRREGELGGLDAGRGEEEGRFR